MAKCNQCGRELIPVEQSLSRKLINRSTTKFYCKTCLANKFSTTEQSLDKMVEQFKSQGCALFT